MTNSNNNLIRGHTIILNNGAYIAAEKTRRLKGTNLLCADQDIIRDADSTEEDAPHADLAAV